MTIPCLTEEQIVQFVQRRLTKEQKQLIEAHLDACPECWFLVAQVNKAPKPEAWGQNHPAEMLLTHPSSSASLGGYSSPRGPTFWLKPDSMLDHFRIIRLIGRGGMSEVYLARDTQLGRKVALKIISILELGSQEEIDRFMAEAQITARFNHPHIVTIYHIGKHEGFLYLALEYLDGQTLRMRLQEERLSIKECLRIGLAIISALSEAHQNQILHRDLKPENIFIPRDGRLRVLDFGLAQAITGADPEVGVTESLSGAANDQLDSSSAYNSGERGIRGTPAYMSPEQWREEQVEAPVDMWAFGIIFYELLAGHHPYDTTSCNILKELVLSPDPVPSLENFSDIPVQLKTLIGQCLEKNPEKRPRAIEAEQVINELLCPESYLTNSEESPFRGLLPFTESQAHFFFGRETEVASCLEKLRKHPLLPLVGPSGSGKSSLVQAGIIPRLREQKRWIVLSLRPGPHPFQSLVERLLAGEQKRQDVAEPSKGRWTKHVYPLPSLLSETLKAQAVAFGTIENSDQLLRLLKERPQLLNVVLHGLAVSTKSQVLLYVDQLEELFTLTKEEEEKWQFLRAIFTAADDPQSPVRVVFSLRDDFFCHLVQYTNETAGLNQLMVLGVPQQEMLEEAITRPLKAVGYTFDDLSLVEEMVRCLKNEAACLPLLEFAASWLWEERDRKQKLITRAAYQAMGGVGGALGKHADSVLQNLTPQQLHLVRHVLLRLVTPQLTRKVALKSQLIDGLNPEAEGLLERLTQARLLSLRKVYHEEAQDIECELSHESLIQNWKQLARWLEESRAELRVLTEVQQAAELWDKRGRPLEEAWQGSALHEARRICLGSNMQLSEVVRRFLDAGLRQEQRRLRRKRLFWGMGISLLVMITVASLIGSWIIAQQRRDSILRWAEAQREGARADLLRGDLLEARAKLRGALEVQDSVTSRAIWWKLSRDALVWKKKLGSFGYTASISSDGRTMAVPAGDNLIHLFDMRTKAHRMLRGHRDQVIYTTFSPNGKYLGSCDLAGDTRLWHLPQLSSVKLSLKPDNGSYNNLVFSHDNRWLASGHKDRMIRIWDTSSGKLNNFIDCHSEIRSLSFSPDGKLLAQGSRDGSINVWDIFNHRSTQRLLGHTKSVPRISFSADGKTLYSASLDDTIRVWNLLTGKELVAQRKPIDLVSIDFNVKGNLAVYAKRNNTISIIELSSGTEITRLPGQNNSTNWVVMDQQGNRVISTGDEIQVWDWRNMSEQFKKNGHSDAVIQLMVAPDDKIAASGSYDRSIILWDVSRGEVLKVLSGHTDLVTDLSFSPDGKRLASVGDDQQLIIWDLSTGKKLYTLQNRSAVTFSFDGQLIASVGLDHSIRLWEATEGKLLKIFLGHEYSVSSLSFSPNGRLLASASSDRNIRLWDIPSGKCLAIFKGHKDWIHRALFSPDGHFLLSASRDKTVRKWDIHTGSQQILATLPARVISIDMDAQGKRIGVSTSDGNAYLMDTEGKIIMVLKGHQGEVNAFKFTKDGQYAMTGSDDWTVRLWDTKTGRPVWHSPLLLLSSPTIYTHHGWMRLDKKNTIIHPPKTAWRQAVENKARFAVEEPSRKWLCLQTYADELEIWDMAYDKLLGRIRLPQIKKILATPHGCLTLAKDVVQLHHPKHATQELAREVSAMDWSGGLISLAIKKQIQLFSLSGKQLATYPADLGVTSLLNTAEWIVLGYKDGNLELIPKSTNRSKPTFSFESIPNSPVLNIIEGPQGILIVGFANGIVGLWSLQNGSQLIQSKLHGPVIHLQLQGSKLYMGTALGDYWSLDLGIFNVPYCELIKQIWSKVPVVWENGLLVLQPPPKNHHCYR